MNMGDDTIEIKGFRLQQKTRNIDKIGNALEKWIEEGRHLSHGVNIEGLARELGINRTYLSNYINDTYRTNFNGWINDHRIKHAQKIILEKPDANLSLIALGVGFSDLAHFSKLFKQSTGLSPSVWRKNAIGKFNDIFCNTYKK